MATPKQRKALKEMVENGGVASSAMVKVGYSENTAKCPSKLTKSKGFKELMDELGLTEDLIVGSLVEDIRMKPQNRKPELELGAKIRGMLADKIDITTQGERIQAINYIIPKDGNDNDKTNTETAPSLSSS